MAKGNKKKGIYCIEGLWEEHDIQDKSSVLPILDLLEKRGECDYIYHDSATKDELELNGERIDLSVIQDRMSVKASTFPVSAIA